VGLRHHAAKRFAADSEELRTMIADRLAHATCGHPPADATGFFQHDDPPPIRDKLGRRGQAGDASADDHDVGLEGDG
jgi:hypothetical protein